MKVLFVSNLFPDSVETDRGQVNARLLHHLSRLCELRVVAPRPAVPLLSLGSESRVCRASEARFEPVYPPGWYLPKIGSAINHRLFAHSIRAAVLGVRAKFPLDVILASWAYPDGCAVDLLARELRVPFLVIAQGSDVHSYLRMPARRRLITDALGRASAVICRSADLAQLLREAGVAADKLHPIYNGVDANVFQPGDRAIARRELGLPADAAVILYVGNLLPVKNPSLLVAAHAQVCRKLPGRDIRLILVGTGALWDKVRREADALGMGAQVTLAGRKNAEQVVRYMQAADVLCVPSDNEGVPNVMLEAFACGLRVVATRVGGIPEVLRHDFLGRLVTRGNADELAAALARTLQQPAEPEKILTYVRQFSWDETVAAYFALLQRAVRSS